jgi:hypothetical protein
MAQNQPNRGYLNANKFKKSDSHPDFRGKIPVDVPFIKALSDAARSGAAHIFISGWKGVSNFDGLPMVSIRMEATEYNKSQRSQPKAVVSGWDDKPVAPAPKPVGEPLADVGSLDDDDALADLLD